MRAEFLTWVNQHTLGLISGEMGQSGAGEQVLAQLRFDGVTGSGSYGPNNNPRAFISTGTWTTTATNASQAVLSEGYHYASAFGKTGGGGTATVAHDVIAVFEG